MTNAIAIARHLTNAGIESRAADAIAEGIVTHVAANHATKADVADLKSEVNDLRSQFNDLRSQFSDLRSQFSDLRSEIKVDMADLKSEIRQVAYQARLSSGMVVGLYVGLAVFFVSGLLTG